MLSRHQLKPCSEVTPRLEISGDSASATSAVAINSPTPGIVINRRAVSSSRAWRTICASSVLLRSFSCYKMTAATCASSLFDCDKAHHWSFGGLADRLGISHVFLLPLHKRLYKSRRDHPHFMSETAYLTCPEMGASAGFHRDKTLLQTTKKFHNLSAPQLLAKHKRARFISPLHLNTFLARSKPIVGTPLMMLISNGVRTSASCRTLGSLRASTSSTPRCFASCECLLLAAADAGMASGTVALRMA